MLNDTSAGCRRSPLLVRLNRVGDDRPTLVCFPHVGGGPASYRTWGRASGDLSMWAIQLPGREARLGDPPFDELELAADAACAAIAAQISGPVALFGHSMGALLAFEVARRLAPPRHLRHLFVAGYPAPQLPRRRPAVSQLSDAELIETLRAQGGGGDPIWEDPEAAKLFLPTIRADYGMLERYRYRKGELLDCPLTVFGGVADPVVKPADLPHWSQQTNGAATVRLSPGGHFFLREKPTVVLDSIEQELA